MQKITQDDTFLFAVVFTVQGHRSFDMTKSSQVQCCWITTCIIITYLDMFHRQTQRILIIFILFVHFHSWMSMLALGIKKNPHWLTGSCKCSQNINFQSTYITQRHLPLIFIPRVLFYSAKHNRNTTTLAILRCSWNAGCFCRCFWNICCV